MILHNSHQSAYRDPIGPVTPGSTLRLRFQNDEGDAVTLRTWDGAEKQIPMTPLGGGLFEASITVPETPMLFWYDFIVSLPEGEIRYGNAADELGGEGTQMYGAPRSYQVTVYDPAYTTPEYLRTGVIYQIFPDRFARSGAYTAAQQKAIAQAHPEATFHPAWNEPPTLDIDPENGDNRALDFFGGTLRGITEKLDILSAMGVTVLYINPIVQARTNHRYDTGDYKTVDPILGTREDFCALTKAADARGMKVLCDGVFSHTGADSVYFNRFGRYPDVGAYQSKESPYFAWYRFDEFPDRYNTWWGFYTLPAVEKNNPDYHRFLLNGRNGVLPLWMKRGACGWRLDVADELPMDLLQEMRTAVKKQNPQGTLLGEVWEDASNKVAYGIPRSYCLGDTLDSVMNYPLRRVVIDFFTGSATAHDVARLVLHQREVYPAPFWYSLMNLLGSHDRVRALNAFAGYDQDGIIQMPREAAQKIRLRPGQLALAKERYLEALRLLCALPGAPTVYYGDELGMQGMADPWNRAPMDWEGGDTALKARVSEVLTHRRTHKLLQTGYLDIKALDNDTLAIRRYAVDGQDAFGDSLTAPDERILITRNLTAQG